LDIRENIVNELLCSDETLLGESRGIILDVNALCLFQYGRTLSGNDVIEVGFDRKRA
jgi:hypothetical protein